MNVVVITNSYPNESKPYAGHHVARHVEMHRAAGVSVRVLHPGESRSGLFFSSWKYLRLGLMVLWTAVFQRFDLVHAHWVLPAGLFGAFLAAVRGKPLVVTSHGAFTNTFEQRNAIVRRLVRLVLAKANKIIVVGKAQREKVETIMGLPAGMVACINMGVLIPETAVSKKKGREQLGLPQDKQLVVFIGNLLKRKGPDILVKAVAQLEGRDSLRVYIGGQGPEAGALARQIEALGLEGVIELVGPVRPEAVYSWLGAADICVAPSRTEPFGLVAVEALACGTVVIAAEVGGLMESVRDGYNGLLFPVGDDKALAERLNRLLDDTALRERLSLAARDSIAHHDMRQKAKDVLVIYRKLVREESLPPINTNL